MCDCSCSYREHKEDRPEYRLILMQGKPGCGKSTVAEAIEYLLTDTEPDDGSRRLVGSSVRITSDKFLYDGSEYVYTPERQAAAHQTAQKLAYQAMAEKTELVIIDNTNLKPQWCQFYVDAAKMFGYDIQVVRVNAERHLQKRQNDMRSPDRIVPLEHWDDTITEDLLYPPASFSWEARLKEAWRWIKPW